MCRDIRIDYLFRMDIVLTQIQLEMRKNERRKRARERERDRTISKEKNM